MQFPALEALIAAFLADEAQIENEFGVGGSESEACQLEAETLIQAAREEATRPEAGRQLESVKRFIRWGTDDWFEGEDAVLLRNALAILESKPIGEWTFCPLCTEIRCDDNCPLYVVRDVAGLWVGSSGA